MIHDHPVSELVEVPSADAGLAEWRAAPNPPLIEIACVRIQDGHACFQWAIVPNVVLFEFSS